MQGTSDSSRLPVSERLLRAAELLGKQGDENLGARLGGIYALGALAKEEKEYLQEVVDVLATFVRSRACGYTDEDARRDGKSGDEIESAIGDLPADLSAIIHFFGTLIPDTGDVQRKPTLQVDLHGTNLARRYIPGIRLPWANLAGVKLQGACLENACLRRACLYEADLQAANLGGAEMRNAMLNMANLGGVNLRCARLQYAYLYETKLQGAFLGSTQLQGAEHLTQEQIDETFHTLGTFLPEGIINRAKEANLGPYDVWSREEYGIPGDEHYKPGGDSPTPGSGKVEPGE